MKKTYLGIEIGNLTIKVAVCAENQIKKFVIEHLPDNMVSEGIILDWEGMSKFLKKIIKKHHITCKDVALVLPENISYVRRLLLPHMTISQLKFNLPYEFRDFITENKEKYIYDYAILGMAEEEQNGQMVPMMDVIAAAISKEVIEKYRQLFKKSGLRLKIAAPEISAYQNIVRKHVELNSKGKAGDYAILNISQNTTNLHIFTEGKYETGKEIEIGLEAVVKAIANTLNIDEETADRYRLNNENDVLHLEDCMSVYGDIALNVMRVINFFLYNHPDNTLDTLYCCGRGANIEPLLEVLEDTIGLKAKKLPELFENIADENNALTSGSSAVGITWN